MTKLAELIAKLSELFELDKAELDFGIHRIIKSKHTQVREYLEKRLPQRVQEELGKLAVEESASQLDALREQVTSTFGTDAIDEAGEIAEAFAGTPLGQEYAAALESSFGAEASSKVENEVYSHLLEFFSRYYEDLDFMSLRRRTAGRESYSIPYNGEEVVLHWANKDQYYIKSSEDLKDYVFTVPLHASDEVNNGRVTFKLTRMDAVQDNNKATRIFQLDCESDIIATDKELVIPFHFAEGKKRTKAQDETWESSLLGELPKDWQSRLSKGDESYTGKGDRNILQKHLRNYTKKNTADYFIHKDLGGFLRRELDFYVKNEVMYLDDIDRRPTGHLNGELRKIKAIRAVAHDLIDFLAQFENFQKKLWLKKKFVIETNWCLSLDRVPKDLYPEIASNNAQREEWVELFGIDQYKGDMYSPSYSEPLTEAFLSQHPALLVDTRHFSSRVVERLIDAIENIDDEVDALLVQSENFQALHTLSERYRHDLDVIYIDPPYNTDAGPIVYKNGYRSSCWASLIENRLALARQMMRSDGVLCITIDDYQVHELGHILGDTFGSEQRLGTAVIRNNPSGRSTVRGFSVCHEYAFFYGATENALLRRFPRTEEQLKRFTVEDGEHVDWRNFRKDGGAVTHRVERPKQFYPLYVNEANLSIRIPELSWNQSERSWDVLEEPSSDETVIYPVDEKGQERVWSLNHVSAFEQMASLEAKPNREDEIQVYRRHIPSDGVLPRSWWDKKNYAAREHGSAALKHLFGDGAGFSFAKSPHAVKDCVWVSGLNEATDGTVLDFFAGSGTTGDAVIRLNREDGARRRFILVEMADYFDSVMMPRIKKVAFSATWKDGRTSSGVSGKDLAHSPKLIKYVRLESYEDTLNNLLLVDRSPDLLGETQELRDEYLMQYCLNLESAASLLDTERFNDPFEYKMKIYDRISGEGKPTKVDLSETFNYLLGLKVRTMQMKDGALVIEGENPSNETVLVIWRNVAEMDNAKLDVFVSDTLRINTADTEYAAIYINGDTTLNDPHKKVRLTEQVFHDLMFDTEDV